MKSMNDDRLISLNATIEALWHSVEDERGELQSYAEAVISDAEDAIQALPSAQPDYQEVLGWLLAYHTNSFDLHGRYLPHEVISWLINDFTKEFIADRNEEE